MDFVSVRVITHDVERFATFWEQLTGLPVTRPVPVFAELRTPTGTIAIGAPATVGMLGNTGPVPGQNRSVFVELRVDDVNATWERINRPRSQIARSSGTTRAERAAASMRKQADWRQ
jgi:predicted enzyme related to lactoylglutathione lyase